MERLILENLQLQMAERSGIRVDDETLNANLRRMARQNGMQLTEFREVLESEGMDYAAFRENFRDQVVNARRIQRQRFGQNTTILNGQMSSRQLRKHCKIDHAGEQILKQALTELGLSARAHDKILRVARTIADLAGRENIQPDDVSEAIMYRRLDRQL